MALYSWQVAGLQHRDKSSVKHSLAPVQTLQNHSSSYSTRSSGLWLLCLSPPPSLTVVEPTGAMFQLLYLALSGLDLGSDPSSTAMNESKCHFLCTPSQKVQSPSKANSHISIFPLLTYLTDNSPGSTNCFVFPLWTVASHSVIYKSYYTHPVCCHSSSVLSWVISALVNTGHLIVLRTQYTRQYYLLFSQYWMSVSGLINYHLNIQSIIGDRVLEEIT